MIVEELSSVGDSTGSYKTVWSSLVHILKWYQGHSVLSCYGANFDYSLSFHVNFSSRNGGYGFMVSFSCYNLETTFNTPMFR